MPTSRISAGILAGLGSGIQRGGQAFAMGGQAFEQGRDQAMNLQSQLAQRLAATQLAQAQAVEKQQEIAFRAPEALRNSALAASGIPLDAAPDADAFVRTGKLGAQYDALPPDQAGPALPRPDWEAKLGPFARQLAATQNALAIGDKSSSSIAKALETNREMALGDRIIAGTVDPMKVSQSQFALKGSAPFNFAEYGVGNNLTGQVDVSGAPAQGFAQKRLSEIRENDAQAGSARASAASSYASADNSRASAARTRSETERGIKSGDIVVQQGADGSIQLVNKLTGVARPATAADGATLMGKTPAPKELNEGQARDNGYGSRMSESDAILRKLAGKYSPAAVNARVVADGIPVAGMVANWLAPEEVQQVEQAQRDFINAILRRESGAAIAPSEFANATKQYFPQPNDKPENLKQKERNRQIAIEGVFGSVPKERRGVPSLSNPIGQPGAPVAPAAGGFKYLGVEK